MTIVGTAPKDFLELGPVGRPSASFVAKAARFKTAGPRECATEHLISRIGRMLPLRVADSRLVQLPTGKLGTLDVRFMSRYFLRSGEELIHGVELVALWLEADKEEVQSVFAPTEKEERNFYTIELILEVLQHVSKTDAEFRALRDGFGRMLAFDALVGANDRHAMNWGVIRDVLRNAPLRYAPIYDTARGLLYLHQDSKLEQTLASNGVEAFIVKFAEGSQPLIGCRSQADKPHFNHFDLIDYALDRAWPEFRQSICPVIRAFDMKMVERMIHKEFGRLFSPVRIHFILELLRYRSSKLKAMI